MSNNPKGYGANLLNHTAANSEATWPQHKVETLRFFIESGMHSFKQIGGLMGITKNAAIGKANRIDLKGPRMTGPKEAGPSTLHSRLDAHHAKLDALLARARPATIVPRVVTDNATRPFERRRSA